MPDHEVLIVGAGPVGLMLACLLGQQGRDVAVYDERVGADARTRAIGVHATGMRVLDAAGIGEQVREEALGLDGGDVVCRGSVLAAVEFADDNRVRTLTQPRTDALLRQRLSQVAGDALHAGCRVTGIHDEGTVVRATVQTPAGEREVTASLVVAADGVRGALRTALGIPWQPRRGQAGYVMMDLPDSTDARRATLYCEPDGLVESFPLPGEMRRWVLSDRTRAIRSADEFRAAIQMRTGAGVLIPDGLAPTSFRARQHLAGRMAQGRVVLLGDAAHEVSPIGGQGMNLGWMAAHALADAISGSGSGRRPDLDEFERRTRRAAIRAQRRSLFYMAMGHPVRAPKLAVRNSLIRLLGSAPLRARTTGMITMRGL